MKVENDKVFGIIDFKPGKERNEQLREKEITVEPVEFRSSEMEGLSYLLFK